MTDPISDMLSRIRNAVKINQEHTVIPHSRLRSGILDILKREGYIKDVKKDKKDGFDVLDVILNYENGVSKINNLHRISKSSQRVYVGKKSIPRSKQGLGVIILTTPKGLMTDREAKKQGVGGEVICEVW